MDETKDNIDVEIFSPGGNMVTGNESYLMLRASGKNIPEIDVSAARVIATARDKVLCRQLCKL